MNFNDVHIQLHEVISRAVRSGVSVQQTFPHTSSNNGFHDIGVKGSVSGPLKNIAYRDIYTDIERHQRFNIKLPDGGLLIFQYRFKGEHEIYKHRLAFFPCPVLPTVEEAPDLYEKDELYGDILGDQIVRFPIRFDYDPTNYIPRFHPHSHLTLGQFDNCRIPVSHALSPNSFFLFVIRNFYHRLYKKNLNIFEKNIHKCVTPRCIQASESGMPHFGFN